MASTPEPWLRGPLPGIPALLQPPAHAFVMAREDVEAAVRELTPEQLWRRPGGAASIGFHLMHLAGSTDRLMTYARGESLTADQREALSLEQADGPRPSLSELVTAWRIQVDRALGQLASTEPSCLLEPREVGRARLPSTVQGLLFHAAEHAQRHVGQLVTTARIVRALNPEP
jgi:uncharacterized damage-inducible protein DinB